VKVLAISDVCNTNELSEVVREGDIDVVFTLGDLDYSILTPLENIPVAKFGVYGNDDHKQYLQELNIHNNHLKFNHFDIWNSEENYYQKYSVFGFEGSRSEIEYDPEDPNSPAKYTDFQVEVYLQAVSEVLDKTGAHIDFFISHSPIFGINDDGATESEGFRYYENFITKHKPKFFLHGHSMPSETVEEFESTTVIYVSGIKVFEIDDFSDRITLE
jgi:Icc-related predicted phosphoesterase